MRKQYFQGILGTGFESTHDVHLSVTGYPVSVILSSADDSTQGLVYTTFLSNLCSLPFLYGGFFKYQRCRNSFFQIITSPLFEIWKRGLRWNWILVLKTWMRRFRFVYPKIWVHFLRCAFHIADGFIFYRLGFIRIFIHFISLRSLRRPKLSKRYSVHRLILINIMAMIVSGMPWTTNLGFPTITSTLLSTEKHNP